MQWLTIASCLVVVMLGALVAPSMTSELSSDSATERLLRLFMEARKKQGGGGGGGGKGGGKKEGGQQQGGQVKPPEEQQPQQPPPNLLEDCKNGDLVDEVLCPVLVAVSEVVAERDPCTHVGVVPEATDDEIINCAVKIQVDLDAARIVEGDKEYHDQMHEVRMQVECLAKALGYITAVQLAKVEAVETGAVQVNADFIQ